MYYKDKIIYNRKLKKLTIKQVAKYLSTGEKTIWNWENGRTQPSKTDLIALSVLFDIPLCEISDYDNLTIFSSTNKNTTQSCTVDGAINIINNIIKKYGDVPEVSISALNKLNNELVNMSKKNQRLTKALNRNNVLFDTINSILYIKDKNRSLIKVNNAFINSIPGNYSLEDIIGSKVIDILGRKEIEELIILENSVFETGLLVIDELIKIPGSNGKKQGLVSIKPVFDKSNDVNEITVCIKDVTRLNEIIEKQSMLTNTVNRLNSEHIWIYRKNPDKFEFISKNAVNLYGIDVNELYKEPSLWKEFLHPDDKEKMEKTYNADKYPLTIKYRVINSEGNIHWVISRRFRGIDKQNKPYYYGINIDVTDSVMQNKKFHELDSAICHSNELIWLGKKTNQNNFKFEYISNNCKKIFGITLPKNKNFIIQKWIHYIYHDDRSKFIDFIKKTNFPKKMTFRIQLINKKLIYVSIKVFKYENTYCGILTDGTN